MPLSMEPAAPSASVTTTVLAKGWMIGVQQRRGAHSVSVTRAVTYTHLCRSTTDEVDTSTSCGRVTHAW